MAAASPRTLVGGRHQRPQQRLGIRVPRLERAQVHPHEGRLVRKRLHEAIAPSAATPSSSFSRYRRAAASSVIRCAGPKVAWWASLYTSSARISG